MQKRKRKSKKDLSPDMVSPPDLSEEEVEEPEEKKKKRGRKKKKKDPVPEIPDELTEVQRVFKLVEQMMSNKGSEAFMERPDDSMYGMSDYYELITKPMWLREVERKFKADEYTSPTEIAADVRLMLENCYHYWGPKDPLSTRALKLEQTFENKLTSLPPDLQKLCSLEATHGDMVKEEPDDNIVKSGNKKGGYVSKLLNWVLNGRGNADGDPKKSEGLPEVMSKEKKVEREVAEKQLAIWENEHLLTPTVNNQISSMWEFPVIGQFLHLVYNVLNIDPISHLELERMLLMPEASKTLATLVTSMLIPPLFRAKLEVGPAMPYCVWTRRLHNKVTGWYRTYHSKGDSTVEVFDSLGIEPQFWLILGEENPLDEYAFHELTFHQRVWLLKGLCDFILHNHKTIQDRINNLEMEELREENLGRDKEGYSYHYFPLFTEVRIYKMAKVLDAKWKSYEGGVEEAITMCAEEDDDEDQTQEQNFIGFSRRPLHKPPRSMRPQHSDFKLVCQSIEDVRHLVNKFCDADPLLLLGEGVSAPLVARLQSIISSLEIRENKMDLAVFQVRKRMKEEWLEHNERSKDFIDPGIAYWERKEKEEKRATEENQPDLASPGTSSDNIFDDEKRERRARRESSLKLLSREENGCDDDESAEESPLDFDDNSEDEWFASKKDKENKKKKRMSAKKFKKLSEVTDKMQHSIPGKETDKLNSNSSSSGFQNSISVKAGNTSISKEPPVKVKQEPCDADDFDSQSFNHKNLQKQSGKSPRQEYKMPKKETPKSNVSKHGILVKQEVLEEQPLPTTTNSVPTSVIQTLVGPVTNVKLEKAHKSAPITPDLSKLKRSASPDDVVYISDSEDPPDIKPNPALLNKQINSNKVVETLNYSMSMPQQQPVNSYLVPNAVPNQYVPVNVTPGDQVFNAQPQVFNVTQPAGQPIGFQLQNPQTLPVVQQPIIRPTQNIGPRANLNTNPKFLVIQQNANNVNQPNQFMNKSPRAPGGNFPTTPTMQSVNWFGPRGSPQTNNYSPRQRSQSIVVVQGQSSRGRGSPRTPTTPTRGVQRFAGRTPTNAQRTPTSMMRTPSPMARTPSPMRGRGITTPTRAAGPVRNLNFNRSPAKPLNKPVNDIPTNDSPDIEGTLVVSLTDSGGYGYAVMLPDGGKISLTSDQLAKIRSDNGGVLPKTCKVPLNMQNDCFRID